MYKEYVFKYKVKTIPYYYYIQCFEDSIEKAWNHARKETEVYNLEKLVLTSVNDIGNNPINAKIPFYYV